MPMIRTTELTSYHNYYRVLHCEHCSNLDKTQVLSVQLRFGMQNNALEWYSEAESAPIRSGVKFCFGFDVRKNLQLFVTIFHDQK